MSGWATRLTLSLHFALLALLWACGAADARALGDDPPKDPILRIEPGMHAGMLRRIATDPENRWLVTTSDDKTARVFDLATGRMERILRTPIGIGTYGKLGCAAVSPDGSTIAVGGVTGFSNDPKYGPPDGYFIYLFNRETGRVVQTLSDLPSSITQLHFTPDGKSIVVGMTLEGVRLIRLADRQVLAQDKQYDGIVAGIELTADGRIVACGGDSVLRIYDANLTLQRKQAFPGGRAPYSLSLSPDETKIAIGFSDRPAVSVLSFKTLEPLYAPDLGGIETGTVSSVVFGRDSATLWAAGSYSAPGNSGPIRRWNGAGRGTFTDVNVGANSTIMWIIPLNDGSIAWSAADPAVGVCRADGTRVWTVGPQTADVRSMKDGFAISPDGSRVQFTYGISNNIWAQFSIMDRNLIVVSDSQSQRAGLAPPLQSMDGMVLDHWESMTSPTLNGKPLPLLKQEWVYSATISPDRKAVVLGTSWYLRVFDATGKQVWEVPALSVAWGVNTAANGKLVVCAFGDGTIRWFRMSDGAELLAFFPHADRKRWVLWTPSGYYDASPGAEDLIGWHLNRSKKEEADFYPVGQFRDRFYRPDIVARILDTFDEADAIRAADAVAGRRKTSGKPVALALPPVVTILSPKNGDRVAAEEIEVRVEVRAPVNAPAAKVWALVDGRPVEGARTIAIGSRPGASAATPSTGATSASAANSAPDGTQTLRVRVPPGEFELSVLAENSHGASLPAKVRLLRTVQLGTADAKYGLIAAALGSKGATPLPGATVAPTPAGGKSGGGVGTPAPAATAAADTFQIQPKLYVLSVGVSAYALADIRLNYAAKDARDVAAAFAGQKGGLYRDVIVKLLVDQEATRDNILDGLDWLRNETTQHDIAAVFLAGHGVNDPDGMYYFLPVNANPDKLRSSCVRFSEIRDTLSSLPGKVLFFVDTCHSGNALGQMFSGRRDLNDLTRVVNELSSAENGVVVFAASTGRQSSLENAKWENGAFSRALVEGISGQAAQYDRKGTGRITINMLDLWLSERVKELTDGKQTPTTIKPISVPDFPLSLKR